MDPVQLTTILVAREQALARARGAKNRRALDVLLAPGFMEISERGRSGKSEILASLPQVSAPHDIAITDPVLVGEAGGSAVLTYRCSGDTGFPGTGKGEYLVSAHFVNRNGKWLLLFRQFTRLLG